MLIPTNYEQYVEVKRQQEARRQDEWSPQYEKLLSDLNASIPEWQAWRRDHRGPGTITALRAAVRWLNPIVVGSGAIPMAAANPYFSILLGMAVAGWPIAERMHAEWTARQIARSGGIRKSA